MRKKEKIDKTIVIPGDLLSDDPAKAGEGTYIENGKVYSLMYGLADDRERIRVIPLSGKYLPTIGDIVIGMVSDLSLIHISEPTRRTPISYAVFCLKKQKYSANKT